MTIFYPAVRAELSGKVFAAMTQQVVVLAHLSSQVRGQLKPEALSQPFCPSPPPFTSSNLFTPLYHLSTHPPSLCSIYFLCSIVCTFLLPVFPSHLLSMCPSLHQPSCNLLCSPPLLASLCVSHHLFLSLLLNVSALGVNRTAFSQHLLD